MLKPKPEDKLRRQGLPSTLSLRRVNPCQGHLGKDRRQDSLGRLGVRGSTVMINACMRAFGGGIFRGFGEVAVFSKSRLWRETR